MKEVKEVKLLKESFQDHEMNFTVSRTGENLALQVK